MDKPSFIIGFACGYAFLLALRRLLDNYYDYEETFWEIHPLENSLEKADDLCEIGYAFQDKEIIYEKTSGKKWFAEILIPDEDEFEIGCELTIENYIYEKNW